MTGLNVNEKEKMIIRLALRDRLRHLDNLGIEKTHVLVTDTEKVLNKLEHTL